MDAGRSLRHPGADQRPHPFVQRRLLGPEAVERAPRLSHEPNGVLERFLTRRVEVEWPLGHGQAAEPTVHPALGRSNHTCTCPVPTEASYSLNSSPGALHLVPPIAAAIIR